MQAQRAPHLRALTGVRFFAALWVLVFHASASHFLWLPSPVRSLASFGYMGVNMFFVLSGFILTYTYRPATEVIDNRRFWLARFARVYPIYAFALVLEWYYMFRAIPKSAVHEWSTWLALLPTPLLVQAWLPSCWTRWNTPGWSLSAEAFFYAIFPFAGAWIARRSARHPLRWMFILVACSAAPVLVVAYRGLHGALDASVGSPQYWIHGMRVNPLLRCFEFLFGVALAQFHLAVKIENRTRDLMTVVAAAAIIGIGSQSAHLSNLPVYECLLTPVFGVLILGLAGESGVARILSGPKLVLLGEASYGIYILQTPVLQMMQSGLMLLGPTFWKTDVAKAIGIMGLIVFSVMTLRVVEVPARKRILERLSPRPPAKDTVSSRMLQVARSAAVSGS